MRILSIILMILSFSAASFAAEQGTLISETAKELLLFYEKEELLSVSFFPTAARKAPGYSFIITNEQIMASPDRSLRDVIEMQVPGMTTGGHERHGPLIGTRGIFIDNNAKTMVMLDEQQINQRSHFGYTAGLLSPLLGDIRQVEIILGPGAILHGSGALNGFINLIPKNGEDDPGFFVSTEYGSAEGLWKAETGYGGSYGSNKNYYIYAGAYGAEGYEPDELYGSTKTFDIHSNGFEGGNYRFSTSWNHGYFSLNTFYYENNPYKNNSRESGYFHQATLGIRPEYNLKINNTDYLELAGSFLWADHSDHRLPSALEGPPGGTGGGAEKHWESKNIYKTTRWEDHSLAIGFLVGEKQFYEKEQFFGDNVELAFETLNTRWKETSIFGEDVIMLNDKWTVSLGLRYDKIDLNEISSDYWDIVSQFNPAFKSRQNPEPIKGHFSPRIATAYDLDNDMTIKASYQHGFRAPDAAYYRYNLIYRAAAESVGIDFPSLKIETLDSYEINLQKNFSDNKIKINGNIFYNIFKDMLSGVTYKDTNVFTPDQIKAISDAAGFFPGNPADIGSFMNGEDVINAWGGEIGVTFHPLSNTEVSTSYGYVKSDAEDMQYPSHQIKLNTLSYFIDNKMSFALNYLFSSGYPESILSDANRIYRFDRHVVDAALRYRITPKASAGLIVKNVLGNDVPPMVFEPDRLDKGGLGYDETQVYLSFNLKI